MNTVRTISRVLVISAVVFVGNACAMQDVLKKAAANQKTLGAIALGTALPENADAAKAALETMGYMADNKDATFNTIAANFALNFAVRKVGRCCVANGLSLDMVEKPLATVSAPVANHVNPVLKGSIKAAAPQLVASLVLAAVVTKS